MLKLIFKRKNRGDVFLHRLDGTFILVDVMFFNPCNVFYEKLANSEVRNPLSNAKSFKIKKYTEHLSKLSTQHHAKYNLYPFVYSLFGSLAPTALPMMAEFN
ncbi:hypothetical protein P9112_004587 [Eukaryota sp. TZLM1-RC]